MRDTPQKNGPDLDELTRLAQRLGASDAAVIPAAEISVEDELATRCQQSLCENYGLATSCPPHVAGPEWFRKLQQASRHAVVFKIDCPTEKLLSNQRHEIFQLLHEIAARVELAAVKLGYAHSKAFAGGSCKPLFCREHPECRVLAEGGACRHPDRARPSMSGFGINVLKLNQSAGWGMDKITRDTDPNDVPMAAVSGLILI